MKTVLQQLKEIEDIIYAYAYDDLSDYLKGIRDMINLLNCEVLEDELLIDTVKNELAENFKTNVLEKQDILWDTERFYFMLSAINHTKAIELAKKTCEKFGDISEKEFDDTLDILGVEELADQYRLAENIQIQNMNGVYKYNFKGSELKQEIIDYLNRFYSLDKDKKIFYDMIDSMAC